MKLVRIFLVNLLIYGALGGLFAGCGPAPYCETDLVTLDELRLDAEIYEDEASKTSQEVSKLENQLTTLEKKIEAIKDKPAELEKKVHDMKKGSGRE